MHIGRYDRTTRCLACGLAGEMIGGTSVGGNDWVECLACGWYYPGLLADARQDRAELARLAQCA